MSWTYRVIKQHVKNKEEDFNKYFIAEVYDDHGRTDAVTLEITDEDYFDIDPIEDLRWRLNRMLEALDKPVVEV